MNMAPAAAASLSWAALVRGSRRPPLPLLSSSSAVPQEGAPRAASSSLLEEITWRSFPGGGLFEELAKPPEGLAPPEGSAPPGGSDSPACQM